MVTPRLITYLGVQHFDSARLHAHAMSIPETTVPDEVIEAARPLIEDFTRDLPGCPGFVIDHLPGLHNWVSRLPL